MIIISLSLGYANRVQSGTVSLTQEMNVPFDPHSASNALGLINSTVATVKTMVGLAKETTNRELQNEVSTVLGNVLDLKIMVSELAEENKDLKAQLAQKASVKRSGEFGYYFKDEETDPLCPKCWEGSKTIAYLTTQRPLNGVILRDCRQCTTPFWEKTRTQSSTTTRSTRGSWMGS